MESWRDITRTALTSGWCELKCTNGQLKVRVKKLPQWVTDEITQLQLSAMQGEGFAEKVKRYRATMAKAAEENRDLTEEESLELLPSVPTLPKGLSDDVARLALEHGIAEHNFTDGAGGFVGEGKVLPKEVIDEVLQWGPLANELTQEVLQFSRPLRKTSKTS